MDEKSASPIVMEFMSGFGKELRASLTVQELCKLDPANYDLQAVILTFDPVEMDVSGLCSAAVTYAQSVAAGRYEVDAAALERQVKSAVLELGLSYEAVRTAREDAVDAAGQVDQVTQAYARGTADKAALYAAQCARDEAIAALYQAMGTFAHQANSLNTLSGGWVAEKYDWMSDTFGTLFQSEILRGEEAARQAEEEKRRQEEEAAQAIQQETQAPEETETQQSPEPSPTETAQGS